MMLPLILRGFMFCTVTSFLMTVGMLAQQFGPVDGEDLSPTDLERVRVGDRAPDFILPDRQGRPHALSDYRGQKVVLVFYRGHW